jgi:tetratricopeptide (TPR) repeat protein
MKVRSILLVTVALVTAFAAIPLTPQTPSGQVEGVITDNGEPVPDASVVLIDASTAKVYKMKTDALGKFSVAEVPPGDYKLEVIGASGASLLTIDKTQIKAGDAATALNFDIARDALSSLPISLPKPHMTREQYDAIKAENARATAMNQLIIQAQIALNAKDWQPAIAPLQQLIEMDPKKWRYYESLGNALYQLGQYERSIETAQKGINVAESALSAGAPKADIVKIKSGIGRMLIQQGGAYLKIKDPELAIAAFTKAAETDPHPYTAYFNLCATLYNTRKEEGLLTACDKAIAADPEKPTPYYIKGEVLHKKSPLDLRLKKVLSPETVETFKKYLELAPEGPYASEVKKKLAEAGSGLDAPHEQKQEMMD